MADQAINALSTKTAPETSDQLLLVGAGEPQLIDYDKLADAILNKITSKNYDLDAGTMTLPAALNALNGKKWKWLFSKDGIPQSFTEYEMNWDACNELLFVYGDYGNAMNTILEPAELFAAHNGEGNRIIIGTIEIYASSSKKSIMIKSSSTERRIRIYGK